MNSSPKHRAALVAAEWALWATGWAFSLLCAALGAYAGYGIVPAAWPLESHLAVAGAVAVVGFLGGSESFASFAASLRMRLAEARFAAAGHDASVPDGLTLHEALGEATRATEDDAARRAAEDAYNIDRSKDFLRNAARWSGQENGEATFDLAPGVRLHYRSEPGPYCREHHFTLLTDDGQQAAITSVDQIRHHLAARADLSANTPSPDHRTLQTS